MSTDYIFEIQSVKAVVIKSVIESIKNCVKEANISISEEGIKISTLGVFQTTLVYLKLSADKFEKFNVKKMQIIGVNMDALYNAIKTVTRCDILTLYMDDPTKLCICIDNPYGGISSVFQLSLLRLDDKIAKVSEIECDTITNMPSAQFQKILKGIELHEGKTIEIKSFDNKLMFSCDDCTNGTSEIKTVVTEIDNAIDTDQRAKLAQNGEDIRSIKFEKIDPSKVVQGKFNMAILKNFTKAMHLCDTMVIYLSNDKPMILEYSVGDMGVLRFMLMPNTLVC